MLHSCFVHIQRLKGCDIAFGACWMWWDGSCLVLYTSNFVLRLAKSVCWIVVS